MGELDKETRDKYETFRVMPAEEVRERITGITNALWQVEMHYAGRWGQLRRKIKAEDLATVNEAVGDLLCLGMNDAVQAEVLAFDPNGEQSALTLLHSQIGLVSQSAMLFLARFENTGVHVFTRPNPNDLPYMLP